MAFLLLNDESIRWFCETDSPKGRNSFIQNNKSYGIFNLIFLGKIIPIKREDKKKCRSGGMIPGLQDISVEII